MAHSKHATQNPVSNWADWSEEPGTPRFLFSEAYRLAVEGDIVNLLVGPLAEARYVAERDNEPFKQCLIDRTALVNYGGSADCELVEACLQNLPFTGEQKSQKIAELFGKAYDFVADDRHWRAVSLVADFMATTHTAVVSYEQAVALIDQGLVAEKTAGRCGANLCLSFGR